MDPWYVQMILNSVVGVLVGMGVIPRLLALRRNGYVKLAGIYSCFFGLNLWFMLDRYDFMESAFRAAIVAVVPLALGFGWLIATKKSENIV